MRERRDNQRQLLKVTRKKTASRLKLRVHHVQSHPAESNTEFQWPCGSDRDSNESDVHGAAGSILGAPQDFSENVMPQHPSLSPAKRKDGRMEGRKEGCREGGRKGKKSYISLQV